MVHVEEMLLDQTLAAEDDLKRIKIGINKFFKSNVDYKIGDEIELIEQNVKSERNEYENELNNFKTRMKEMLRK